MVEQFAFNELVMSSSLIGSTTNTQQMNAMILKRSTVIKEKYDVEIEDGKRYVFIISHHEGYDGNFVVEKLWTDDRERVYPQDFPKLYDKISTLVKAHIDKGNGN